jgi:glutamate synthase (ferredoxin)
MTGGRVAVLGPVGDNFAAGMSGGIAWVLDEEGTLTKRLNPGHVRAYPVARREAEELRQLLEMHGKATGSKKAGEILGAFAQYLPKFRTVISDEYLAHLQNKGA